MKSGFSLANKAPLKISGTRPRLVLGCWLLAALLLAGHNGWQVMSLVDRPLSGHSPQVRLASEKWRQLQEIKSQTAEETAGAVDLDLAFAKIASHLGIPHRRASDTPRAEENRTETPPTALPKLSGILRCTDVKGNVSAVAVIEGRRFQENDVVRNFIVQKIEAEGVVLAQGGRRWFLKPPAVTYSTNHEPRAQGGGP